MESSDLSPTLAGKDTFAAAPYVHAYNEPKYHASQIRALAFGSHYNRVVLWLLAEDRPKSKMIGLLDDRSHNARRQQWLTYHDQKTGGIMGLQPLVRDMPLRLTETDYRRKDKRLFRNSRCRLFGWKLHPVDQERWFLHGMRSAAGTAQVEGRDLEAAQDASNARDDGTSS